MLTLTYPGDWLTVAPDGETVKRHFNALAKRYERGWREPLVCVWKLEFHARGAPHFHISTTPPMGFTTIADPDTGGFRSVDFKTWLSITWADIVAHPDPEHRHRAAGTGVDYAEGIKVTDPPQLTGQHRSGGVACRTRGARRECAPWARTGGRSCPSTPRAPPQLRRSWRCRPSTSSIGPRWAVC
jgi:hypothetical protein